MYEVQSWPLCLDHYAILQKMEGEQQTQRAAMMNFLMDQMDETTGITSGARVRIPQPIIHQGNMTQNYIKVDRSIVGTINTGTIQALNQSLQNLQNINNIELAKGITVFINAALNNDKLSAEQKQEAVENASFVAEQMQLPATSRKKSLLGSASAALLKIASVSADLLTLWSAIHPLLQ